MVASIVYYFYKVFKITISQYQQNLHVRSLLSSTDHFSDIKGQTHLI